jgi:predicted ATPase
VYIAHFQVSNYKSFSSFREIDLEPGFNVIVGQNNVGKTALVEALSLQFGSNPHRSLGTVPTCSAAPNSPSSVNIAFALGRDEIEELLTKNLPTFTIPADPGVDANAQAAQFMQPLWNQDVSIIQTRFENGSFASGYLSAYGNRGGSHLILSIYASGGSLRSLTLNNSATPVDDFARGLATSLISRIYSFRAVRFNIQASGVGADSNLAPDATNLAQVLHLLQSSNPSRFRRFNELVNTIFPQVKHITVPPVPGTNVVQILLWNVHLGTERDDLAVPLSESGTGVGQVLAILYVVLTSEYPRTIIIDEPQSFLHPGAVRKLIDILKQYPQHQYIITTHSPTAVTAADPQALLLVRKEEDEAESTIDTVDVNATQQLRRSLYEVGARLSDVFGADNVLWVEGRTEEQCFPVILSRLANRPLLGTSRVRCRRGSIWPGAGVPRPVNLGEEGVRGGTADGIARSHTRKIGRADQVDSR